MRHAAFLVLLLAAAPSWAQPDPDRLKSAKALFFDRKYAEARQAWQRILAGARGAEADTAAYWVARSSENLGEDERALKEYADFLARRPTDRALAEEARTSRVGLAARLYKAGRRQHLPILREALKDPSKTVRYFAALQLSTLGRRRTRRGAVLQKIVQERRTPTGGPAKVGLLRLDPAALSRTPGAGAARPSGEARWLKVRIFEKGGAKPKVVVNLPVALADMVFKSLPDEAREKLRLEGYDAENFWERMKGLGPSQIVDIEGDEGEKIQLIMSRRKAGGSRRGRLVPALLACWARSSCGGGGTEPKETTSAGQRGWRRTRRRSLRPAASVRQAGPGRCPQQGPAVLKVRGGERDAQEHWSTCDHPGQALGDDVPSTGRRRVRGSAPPSRCPEVLAAPRPGMTSFRWTTTTASPRLGLVMPLGGRACPRGGTGGRIPVSSGSWRGRPWGLERVMLVPDQTLEVYP